VGDLADRLRDFQASRLNLIMPDLSTDLDRYLYATFISFLEDKSFAYDLDMRTDNRGWLSEFIKSKSFGQIFISRTKPGITRGNHWHHTKVEKFLVVDGKAKISFRHVETKKILKYSVSGERMRVVDIPPGYIHSIENTGKSDLITIFWADELFDVERPDTYYEEVYEQA